MCEGIPTAYVNGCSYNLKGNLQAGAGVVWLNNNPCPLQQLKLGPQSSQYAQDAEPSSSPYNWLHPTTSNNSSVPLRNMPVQASHAI